MASRGDSGQLRDAAIGVITTSLVFSKKYLLGERHARSPEEITFGEIHAGRAE